MIPRTIAIGLFLLSAALLTRTTKAESPAEVQDVLFLHPRGLLNVQLQILRDGQGYQAVWGEFLWEMFEELDTDGSFDLDYQEFRRGDWTRFRERDPETGYTVAADHTFLDFDSNPPDELVSFTEVVETLGQSCCQASYGGQTNPNSSTTTDALFAALDRNENEELEQAEMLRAFASLRKLDRNDDELYTVSELRPQGNPIAGGNNIDLAFQINRAQPRNSQKVPVITPPPGTSADVLAKYVLRFYDRPPKQEGEQAEGAQVSEPETATLSHEEFEVPDVVFEAIDVNDNAELELAELTSWLSVRQPDATIAVRLDDGLEAAQRVEITSTESTQDGPINVNFEKTESGEVRISLPTTQVVITAAGPRDIEQDLNGLEEIFKRRDSDNNDYLDTNEARQLGITGEFNRIDADHNGQLFFEELAEYRRREAAIASRRNDLAITNRGSTLFEIVESNGNQVLSARELSQIEELTAGWDHDNNNALAMNEIPRRYQLSVRPGAANNQSVNGVVPANIESGTFTYSAVEPNNSPLKWFIRMDRNNDGDLSPREFLGPREDFDRMDANNDQLVSQKEATALYTE